MKKKKNIHPVSLRIKYTRYIIPILLISFFLIGIIDTVFYFYSVKESSDNEKFAYMNTARSSLDSYFNQFTLDSSIFCYKNSTQRALINIPQDNGKAAKDTFFYDAPYYPYLSANYVENTFFVSQNNTCFSTSTSIADVLPKELSSHISSLKEISHNYHGMPFLYKLPDNADKLYLARDIYKWTGKASTTGKYYLGTLIVEPKSGIFDKIFSTNNTSYQFILADEKKFIYINNSDLSNDEIISLMDKKELCIKKSLYAISSMPLTISNIRLFLVTNKSNVFKNANTFIFLLLIPFLLSLFAIISATKFISRSIANEFDYFMKKLNETQIIDKHAFIHMDTSTEFSELSSVYNQTLSRIHSLSEKIHEQEILTKNIEIESLQAQINPHFLYNTLNCISGLVDMGRKEECHRALIALADIERMSLKGKPFCTIEEDLHYIKEYTYIQQLRFEDNLSILIDIPQKLYKYYIPKLVIQPLIENAVIHGTSKIADKGLIAVLGRVDNTTLQISVKDNGPGFPENLLFSFSTRDEKGNSYGLYNINRRLKLYYGDNYGLILKNNKKRGACVTICIPFISVDNTNTSERN